MALAALAPLAQARGVVFYSLQKWDSSAEPATSPPAGMRLVDLTGEMKTMDDMAAMLANLDLVITVETAAAHLAGAMGRPVWTLLPFAPAWRWMLGREDSPWYRTMRLFRQGARGEWGPVVERVAGELRKRVQGSALR
jgi:ADP-heptose:LPS heptosyltransferase